MEYKRFSGVIAVRLDIGDEIVASVKEICKKENITGASVSGIGALSSAVLGVYNVENGEYANRQYNEFMELTSLVGNVSVLKDNAYIHLHATMGRHDCSVIGGHLRSAVIGATCELFITPLSGTIKRTFNAESGLNVFNFEDK